MHNLTKNPTDVYKCAQHKSGPICDSLMEHTHFDEICLSPKRRKIRPSVRICLLLESSLGLRPIGHEVSVQVEDLNIIQLYL